MWHRASRTSTHQLGHMRDVQQELIERALEMRCVAYLVDVKARLLVQTVQTVGASKRQVGAQNVSLQEALALAEKELEARRRAEQRFREVADALELAPALVLVARDGEIVYANHVFRTCFGAPEEQGLHDELARRGLGRPAGRTSSGPYEAHVEREGTPRVFRVALSEGQLGEEAVVSYEIAVINDVTSEWESKEQLQRLARSQAVGRVVAGVAHDFNNLLMAIATNVELLEVVGPDERAEIREAILDATVRGGSLTRQLLAFTQQQQLRPSTVTLGEVIGTFTDLLRRSLGETHRLEVEIDAPERQMHCDGGQLQAALMNLVVNGRDASSGGGVIALRVGEIENPALRPCGPGVLPAGRFVAVSVRDSGPGIPPKLAESLWDPYVSTKREVGHSGMGLSMVSGFAQQSGGGVEITSIYGEAGAEFTLYIPLVSRGE